MNKKVLIVSYLYYPFEIGGGEVSTKLLAEQLVGLGYDVLVLTCGGKYSKCNEEKINGVMVIRYPCNNDYWLMDDEKRSGLRKLIWHFKNQYVDYDSAIFDEVVRGFDPGVVVLSQIIGFSYKSVQRLKKKYKVPLVYVVRDYSLLDFRSGYIDHECGGILCRLINSVLIFGRRRIVKFIDRWVYNSNYMRLLYGKFLSVDGGVVANTTPLSLVDERLWSKTEEGPLRVVYVGGLDYHKGICLLVSIIEMVNEYDEIDVEFNICGNGNQVHLVERLVEKFENVNYLGVVKGDIKNDVLFGGDVLLHTSIWGEPYPRVIWEAIAYGMLVLATKVGGVPEMIDDSCGELFEVGKPEDAVAVIKDFYLDRSKFLHKVVNSQKMVKYKIRENVTINVYDKVLSEFYE